MVLSSLFFSIYPYFPAVDFSKVRGIEGILKYMGSSYYTDGLASLKSLKKNSFDLIYSQAVLEYVRLHEFKDTMIECYKLLKPSGRMSHVVDFKDHLGGLNNMP